MDRYVVIGSPVAHSQSPFIHAAFARQTGQAMEYGRLLCPPDGFEATLRAFAAQGGRGCNVTVPFKFDAFRVAHAHTPRAALAGACNALRHDAEGWLGDNTDGAGLLRDIERNAGVALQGRRILLLGAGGAAAGVLGPLLAAQPAQLVVANRTPHRAIDLLRTHRAAIEAIRAAAIDLRATSLTDCGEAYDVVINATASSMLGAPAPVSSAALAAGALAVDMMYGPAAKGFLEWAKAHGATGRDGLGMLVEQAAEAFELFRGVQPVTAPVLAALRRHLAESVE
ncbi:MAG TPA: shikimate dehydrogenase [Caldimonas sp.]